MDELDGWLQVAWADMQGGSRSALVAMLCLWRGLRVSEVLDRVVRDLDEEGSVLVTERAKTRAGNRRVDLPEFLPPHVQRLSEGQPAHAWLFRQERDPSKPRPKQVIHKCVRSICRRAGVPAVCTHSLRGLNATLKLQAAASEGYIARSIGHTSFGITLRHYVDPTVKAEVDAWRVDVALSWVGGISAGRPSSQPLSVTELLRTLSDQDRQALLQALLAQGPLQ